MAGEPAAITVYPGAHHGFDGPSSQPRLRLDVPNGVNPGRGVTVATDPAARDDAQNWMARVRAIVGPTVAVAQHVSPNARHPVLVARLPDGGVISYAWPRTR